MEIRKLYDELEDANEHGLAAMLVCVARKDHSAVVRMGEIIKAHLAAGGMTADLCAERFALSQPHYNALQAAGVFIKPPVTVNLLPDYDAESPCDEDGWSAYSFSRKHANYKHPDELGFDEGQPSEALQAKLKAGLAFILDYFEHGNCVWSLGGTGPQCRWDSVSGAGILVWEGDPDDMGAKTYEDREKDAKGFIDRFTEWCNGNVFGYSIDDPDGEIDDSCFGFYDSDLDYMFSEIREAVGKRKVVFAGDCQHMAAYHWKEEQ